MDQGTATVLAAMIGVAGVVLAGLGGVWIGGRISAGAAKEAAKIAADAAHESSVLSWGSAREDREEARAARFADRVRELAVEVGQTAETILGAAHVEIRTRSGGYMPTDVSVPVDPKLDRWMRELRLISRLAETREATDRLDIALNRALSYVVTGQRGGVRHIPTSIDGWEDAEDVAWNALDSFETAIQAELGVVQVGQHRGALHRPATRATARPPAAQRSKADTDSGEGASERPGAS
jgi:multidrug efflux pump subunit AcrA (membrane-fusion protein)